MRPHPITAYQSKSECCQAMGQLSEQITLSYFVTNNAQKGQMGFLPDQRLLVIKEFSRGTDGINYCCEHNILVPNYKQSRKMISGAGSSVPHLSPGAVVGHPAHCCHLSLSTSTPSCVISVRCGVIASVCWGAACSNHYPDPAAGLASKRTVLTTEALEALTIHSLSLHNATYQRPPAVRTSASILLVKIQFRHFKTYCRAEWGATRENREICSSPTPPHCPKEFKQWSAAPEFPNP